MKNSTQVRLRTNNIYMFIYVYLCIVACSGMDTRVALEFLIQMSQSKAFKRNIHNGIKESLRTFLPQDILARCNGRLHVCVTKVWPNPQGKVTIINHFDSLDQLLDVIAASCFIPLYSAPSIAAVIGQERYIDGGIFAFLPPIGEIKVSPIPITFRRSRQSHIHVISKKFSIPQLITGILIPAKPAVLRDLFEEGIKSAEFWIRKEQTKAKLTVYIEKPL